MELSRRQILALTGGGIISIGTGGYLLTRDTGGLDEEINESENGDTDSSNYELPTNYVDTPPNNPTVPTEEEWNENYLGLNMDEDTDIEFETFLGSVIEENQLTLQSMEYSNEFFITVLENENEYNDTINTNNVADDIDFEEQSVIAIESGYGPRSTYHNWVRIDEYDDIIWIHGFYVKPFEQTTDISERESVIILEKPTEEIINKDIYVSLNVTERHRVTFADYDHVVQLEDGLN